MAIIRSISTRGTRFVSKHEGFVSKAYRCPAGVITIGYGFTMRSRVFAAWWRRKYNRALRMGDTITRTDADILLPLLIDEEYGAAVVTQISPATQPHYDGASSVAFNCGPGSLKWRWAVALKNRRPKEAARLLRTTAVTANGRRLAGLVRRRKEEAALIEFGKYGLPGNTEEGRTDTRASVKQYQQWLKDLGYYKGKVDGITGKQTIAAVKAFQQANDLVVDGDVGSATLSTLIRVKDSKVSDRVTGGTAGGSLVTTVSESVTQGDWPSTTIIIVACAAVVIVAGGLWLWRNRGRVTGKRVAVA